MMSELTKSIIGPTYQQCCSDYKKRTRNNKCSLRTEQRKHWKTHRGMNRDTSKVSKTMPTSEPWLQQSHENWPKPWCQVIELEPEQVTSTVATETKLDQLFGWRRYSAFNRIRNFLASCKRFKTKQRGTLKADKNNQAEQILFRFVQNESFLNVSKSIANSK